MALNKPEKKMSKSDVNSKSRILVTDSSEDIHKKINAAVTDSIDGISFDPENRPGVSNLISLIHHVQGGNESHGDIAKSCSTKKDLKHRAAECLDNELTPIRTRYLELMSAERTQYLQDMVDDGAARAQKSAEETMRLVRNAVGFGQLA